MARAQAALTQNGMLSVLDQCPEAMSPRVMTPIVFCASFVPCASDTSEAEPIWPQRNPWSVKRWATPETTWWTTKVPTVATIAARTGEATAGMMTFPTTPSILLPSPFQFTPAQPRPATVAPMRPPKRACEELEGRPISQVSRFQAIAPTRPARTMSSSADPPPSSSSGFGAPLPSWILTTALETVRATSTERKAPTRFRTPERPTATLGGRAPVAMDVAIAFAVSWKPLVKSKVSATTTTSTRMSVAVSTGGKAAPRRTGPEPGRAGPREISPRVHRGGGTRWVRTRAGLPDDVGVLVVVVVAGQHVAHRGEAESVSVVANIASSAAVQSSQRSRLARSIGESFHCRTGSIWRMRNRVRCSAGRRTP